MRLERLLLPFLKKYLRKKILLLSGPRQCGKTTLAKMLSADHAYTNFDNPEDRLILTEQSWDRDKQYIIFDELHKKTQWKSWLKGVFDSEGVPPGLLVTGSAKLDIYKRAGDSMAGRFFSFRLFPLTLKELCAQSRRQDSEILLDRLLLYSGFPEPYLEANQTFYNLWKKTHIDTVIRQDLIDMESVRRISKIELLMELLKQAAGSPVPAARLALKLDCSPKTVQNWLEQLEKLYIIFKVPPYNKNISRSLKKASKYYFYNWTLAGPEKGAVFENFIACSLLAENKLREDTRGEERGLYFLRNRDKREIDFLLTKDKQPSALIEAKWTADSLSPHFKEFSKYFRKNIVKIQLIKVGREKTFRDGSEIRRASNWLSKMPYDRFPLDPAAPTD